MATNVVPFASANLPVPSHIAKFLNDNANIDPKDTVPQLSFRGKVWRIVINGEETVVTKDEEPVSQIRVVVVDHNKARSRTFYEGAYDPKKPMPPSCWSLDGVKPDPQVKEPQCESCAKCPQSVKGSKVTDNGKEVTACSVYKRVVVVPHNDLGFTPLLLKLPQTSMWDGNNKDGEAKGWYAWDQYLDMLRSRGAVHTCVVVTRIKFDSRAEYPKLLFSAQAFLDNDEMEQVTKLLGTDPVTSLLKASEEVVAKRSTNTDDKVKGNGKAAPADDDDDEAPVAPPKAAKKKAAAAPAPADDDDEEEPAPPPKAAKKKAAAPPPDDDDDDGFDDDPEPAKAKAAPADDDDDEEPAPPPKAAKKKAAAPPPDDDDDEEPAPPPKAKKAAPPPDDDDDEEPAPPKKKAAGKAPAGLSDLMAEWDKKSA